MGTERGTQHVLKSANKLASWSTDGEIGVSEGKTKTKNKLLS